MPNGYVIFGLLFSCLIHEVSSLQCYHCGWSRERKNYQTRNPDDSKEFPYPVADRHMAKNDAEQAELSDPPSQEQLEKYCKKQTCSGKNDACVIWTFQSNHPINITYMCVSNPKNLSGCFRQKIENKDFLEIEACLCSKKNFCNDAKRVSGLKAITAILAVLAVFFNRGSFFHRLVL